MHDQLIVAKVQAATCDLPRPNRSTEIIIVTATLLAVTFILITLRLISRVWMSSTIGPDGWIIALALLLSVPSAAFTISMSKEGFGRHIWDLADGSLLNILRSFYIAESFYVVTLSATKISVLVLYLRIFPHRSFQFAAYATIAMIAVSTIIIFFMTVFACKPVAFFWNRDIRGGTCLDINKLAYANSAMSIIQDILIVVLPLPPLMKLNMGRKKKIGVGFMFAVGGFGCVVSMIRLRSLLSFGNSLDPTWDYVNVVLWTIAELAIAMVCSCLPAIRNLLIRIYPRAFITSIRNRDYKQPDSNTGLRYGSHVQEGFIELQQMNEPPPSDIPPEVPPKDPPVLHTTNKRFHRAGSSGAL
ncbi:hypothetical protein B0O99DRAFT_635611 [Bisporella sp. PMI_857]|nr:hypothetical protein B0O99DRAFT_635611 [Bisporella sp. PMI_857]